MVSKRKFTYQNRKENFLYLNMKELPLLKDRAKSKLSTTGNSRFAFLRGYELGAREALSLLLELCSQDVEVDYTQLITMRSLEKKIETLIK